MNTMPRRSSERTDAKRRRSPERMVESAAQRHSPERMAESATRRRRSPERMEESRKRRCSLEKMAESATRLRSPEPTAESAMRRRSPETMAGSDERWRSLERVAESAKQQHSPEQMAEPAKQQRLPERMAEPERRAHNEMIVWPPVVIVENTRLGVDPTTRKFTGLDNEEVRTFLRGVNDENYSRVMALYDKAGHKGKSIVTFPADDIGYINAQALSDCLQRLGRGRDHWMKVKPYNFYDRGAWNGEGLVTKEGKRILYGYLARPEDMEAVDPFRKHLKRWSVESLEEKVLRPAKQRNQDAEETEAKRKELEDLAQKATVHLENERTGVDKLREAINKINEELEAGKQREALAEARHRQELGLRRRAFGEALQQKKDRYQKFEEAIRAQLAKKKSLLLSETMKLTQEAQELQNAIEEKKKNHEIRQRKALEEMKNDCELQAMMEASLAELKKRNHERVLELQKKHQEETMKLKEQNQKEKEDLLQKHLTIRTELENNADIAKEQTNRLKAEADSTVNKECVVCFFEFGSENLRAFFAACGHANVCIQCAQDLWQRKNKACPTCKTIQKKKPVEFPVNIYL